MYECMSAPIFDCEEMYVCGKGGGGTQFNTIHKIELI